MDRLEGEREAMRAVSAHLLATDVARRAREKGTSVPFKFQWRPRDGWWVYLDNDNDPAPADPWARPRLLALFAERLRAAGLDLLAAAHYPEGGDDAGRHFAFVIGGAKDDGALIRQIRAEVARSSEPRAVAGPAGPP
jgi:hypothetical protein